MAKHGPMMWVSIKIVVGGGGHAGSVRRAAMFICASKISRRSAARRMRTDRSKANATLCATGNVWALLIIEQSYRSLHTPVHMAMHGANHCNRCISHVYKERWRPYSQCQPSPDMLLDSQRTAPACREGRWLNQQHPYICHCHRTQDQPRETAMSVQHTVDNDTCGVAECHSDPNS